MKFFIFLLISIIGVIGCSSTKEIKDGDNKNSNYSKEPVMEPLVYQQKFIKGTDFFARGNEPFWTLEIDFEKAMTFNTLYDINMNTPAVEGTKLEGVDVTRYNARTEQGELIVTTIKEDCQDNMSGEEFDYKVVVEAKNLSDKDYKLFNGCGKYLYDFRLNGIWIMEEMTGVELKKEELLKGFPTFGFDLNKMRFSGHAGCNNLTVKIELKSNKITFGNIAATMLACPDMMVERAVVDAINKNTFDYKIDNQKLTLENESTKIVFKKEK